MPPPATVVFLHVPKTAGSTLRAIVARQYDPAEVHTVGMPVEESVERFRALPEDRRHAYRLVQGHMAFGLHPWLRPPVAYVTMLRDPVERVLSQFGFVRGLPAHELHGRVRPGMTVGDYVRERVHTAMDNGQVRLLSGDPYPPFGELTDDHLARAKRHLEEHVAVAGLSERFDESLVLMADALGWRRSLRSARRNVTRGRIRREDVTPDDVEAIREANRLDLELHALAADRLEAQVAAAGEGFARRVRSLRAANRAASAVAAAARPALAVRRALTRGSS